MFNLGKSIAQRHGDCHERVSSTETVISLFVNETKLAETRTNEGYDYGTEQMCLAPGSVHHGESQNFDGVMDEVRIHCVALSDEEIRRIYHSPRREKAE